MGHLFETYKKILSNIERINVTIVTIKRLKFNIDKRK